MMLQVPLQALSIILTVFLIAPLRARVNVAADCGAIGGVIRSGSILERRRHSADGHEVIWSNPNSQMIVSGSYLLAIIITTVQ